MTVCALPSSDLQIKATDAPGVDEDLGDRVLHVDLEALVHAVVLQRPDHLQAGAIADVGKARIFMSAEISLMTPAILRAIKDRPPLF